MSEEEQQHPAEEQQEPELTEFERLQRLVAFLKESGVTEYTSERESELGARKLSLKFASPYAASSAAVDPAMLAGMLARSAPSAPAAAPASAPAQPAAAAPVAAQDEEAGWHIVKSPIVGTFYESPSPGASAFVTIGDRVDNGQVLCIVEAMKLMNEIESDGAGEIVKRFVQNGQPVEYGQKLFALKA